MSCLCWKLYWSVPVSQLYDPQDLKKYSLCLNNFQKTTTSTLNSVAVALLNKVGWSSLASLWDRIFPTLDWKCTVHLWIPGVQLEGGRLWFGYRPLHTPHQSRSFQNSVESHRQHLAKLWQDFGMAHSLLSLLAYTILLIFYLFVIKYLLQNVETRILILLSINCYRLLQRLEPISAACTRNQRNWRSFSLSSLMLNGASSLAN